MRCLRLQISPRVTARLLGFLVNRCYSTAPAAWPMGVLNNQCLEHRSKPRAQAGRPVRASNGRLLRNGALAQNTFTLNSTAPAPTSVG